MSCRDSNQSSLRYKSETLWLTPLFFCGALSSQNIKYLWFQIMVVRSLLPQNSAEYSCLPWLLTLPLTCHFPTFLTSVLKTEAVYYSETFVPAHQNERFSDPEGHEIYIATYKRFAWLIITASGSDDWIYWRLIYNYNSSQLKTV
jgi:hypothetical protein